MKNTFNVHCRRCGYEKDFYLGVGLLRNGPVDFDSEHALLPKMVSAEELVFIKKRVEAGESFESNYQYGVFHCPDCGRFFKRMVYALRSESEAGTLWQPTYRCSCGSVLEPVELASFNPKAYCCPECGTQSLYEEEESFFW